MKKTTLLIALVAISSVAAQAHIEPGPYLGRTPEGKPCGMVAIKTYFEGETPHPLAERVQLRVGADEFVVHHPTVIDRAESVASFNHDFFEGVLPVQGGAKALVVEMIHEEGHEGPRSFTWIENRWKNNLRQKIDCGDLKLQR